MFDAQGSAFPVEQQLLIHQGKVLKDDTTLEDNKVSEKGFLVVMITKVLIQLLRYGVFPLMLFCVWS